ncbi:complement C1q tumor necrosis factor-related protein 1 isoform X2 [Lutra lutra]|uniref:complement C1q tumor necrosis factor-related protein 1 isoform X2 n=1 Tax=Lutra lutra TaxID=9657 RepID=UPI001FD4CB9A|nr:complement C1q tumor necrosis factor-related protein 1 isoform X2 [Lutra lutra]
MCAGSVGGSAPCSHLAGVCSLRVCPAFLSLPLLSRNRASASGQRDVGPEEVTVPCREGRGPAAACTHPPLHLLPRGLFPSSWLSPLTSLLFPRPGWEEAPPPGDAPSPRGRCRTRAGGTGGTMGSRGLRLVLAGGLLLAFACGPVLGRVPRGLQEPPEQEGIKELPLDHAVRDEENHEKHSPRRGEEAAASPCFRCCDPGTPVYQAIPVPQINITILKGEKGDRGDRGLQGKYGKTGSAGARGHVGPKGQKGSIGAPGDRCKNHYAAFSVGRKKPLHSNDYYQTLVFDTEFVNLYGHFNMFTGKFYCYVPGIYFFSLNVHTWNQKETYLHVMKNAEEVVILYAQVSDRSIMQSQSLMLELRDQDEVWVRLFKGERENAIFSDEFDTYITFSGYLVKPAAEP